MAEATVHHEHIQTPEERRLSIDNQKFGMWLYLASEIVIFAMMIAGYILFRLNESESVKVVQEELGLGLVSVNTFILLASSWAMVMGLISMWRGNRQMMMRWIFLTAVLGSAFLGGQYIEYSELGRLQITLEKNIISEDSELVHAMEALGFTTEDARAELLDTIGGFGMRFYAPTAFHGAHVFVGVLWALLVLYRGSKGRYDHNPIGIELFGLYWHFVDVVWIMLFTLIYLI